MTPPRCGKEFGRSSWLLFHWWCWVETSHLWLEHREKIGSSIETFAFKVKEWSAPRGKGLEKAKERYIWSKSKMTTNGPTKFWIVTSDLAELRDPVGKLFPESLIVFTCFHYWFMSFGHFNRGLGKKREELNKWNRLLLALSKEMIWKTEDSLSFLGRDTSILHGSFGAALM